MDSALSMHDALLTSAPVGARHDSDVCPFCTDWAMTEDGIPSGFGRLELADAQSPYGAVDYADPGYMADKVKRYPLDTESHAKAAWSYIHQASNAARYSADELSQIRTRIAKALKKFGEAVEEEPSKTKPKAPKPDAASEGGTQHMETNTQDTISAETHAALLEKALRDATAALETEKADLTASVSTLTAEAVTKDAEIASLKSDNERLNGELDTAQVSLKTAQDDAAALRADIASKEADAAKAEIASARATQVRNLALFTEEYVTEKSARWADMDEAAWDERLEEWKVAKGTTSATTQSGTTTDTASAMTGTREAKSGDTASARRQVLGLEN